MQIPVQIIFYFLQKRVIISPLFTSLKKNLDHEPSASSWSFFLKKNLIGEYGSTMDNEIGNISTIVKFISMTIAGYLLGALAAKGLNLPIDATTLSQLIGTILFFIIAYIDAKFPNTFGYPTEETVLNEEYETEVEEDGC